MWKATLEDISVMICAADDTVLYQGRPKKGDEGVAGSPLEFYDGILVSDHEAALIKHGFKNQKCMARIKRYVIHSIENEKDLTWNTMMKEWVKEAVTYWNDIHDGGEEAPEKVAELLQGYDEIIAKAKTEYEYEPPSEYFKEGYNLYKRMEEEKERYTLFCTIQRWNRITTLQKDVQELAFYNDPEKWVTGSYIKIACGYK